jgi:hypothetical protein
LVSDIKARTKTEGILEQGAEENICSQKVEIIGGWRKLHNEELHKYYSSSNIIRMMKSRRMRWAGYVSRMEIRKMHTGFWWESQKEQEH